MMRRQPKPGASRPARLSKWRKRVPEQSKHLLQRTKRLSERRKRVLA
jgi:hypothetical protein